MSSAVSSDDDGSAETKKLREPAVWGGTYWAYYDFIVNTYPRIPSRRHQKVVSRVFRAQVYCIPCGKCARNYRKIVRQYPPRTESREALQKWLEIVKAEVAKHIRDRGHANTATDGMNRGNSHK